MKSFTRHLAVVCALFILILVTFISCATAPKDEMAVKKEAGPTSATPAAELRTALNGLLQEHVFLAADATGAALGGHQAEFEAAAAALDGNSVDLAKANGSVYGADAEAAFLPLWRKHIAFVVDYTVGVATKDKAKQEKAVNDLVAYSQEFGAFLNSASPSLPADVVAELVKGHILTLKEVIDAQAAGDFTAAYTALRAAAAHMPMIADAHAGAIVKQFPDKFPGSADSPPATLRSGLNLLLREHVFLAAAATNAALGARGTEFKAAAAALDANSVALAQANGSVYGADAEAAFLPLWRKHIGFVVDYTVGLATKDTTKQEKAVNDLVAYSQEFGAFLNSASPSLPVEAVAELVKGHILSLKAVIDAQAAGDQAKAFTDLRPAVAHMQMISDAHAEAIVKQFPDKFSAK
jgi:hypothetical protein